MSRSAPVWAVRAQLLAKLRPFADGSSGKASLELLPDLHHHIRGLSPGELRLVMAAYAKHSEMNLQAEDLKSLREMQAHLVQLLVGGSRLGTSSQLLEAADAIARFAPCNCLPAAEFWAVFANRVCRLVASESLDGALLARVFAACAQWKRRCHGDMNWGHMLRVVGGTLAEDLDALRIPEVVTLAKDAAQLGEPQVRLAAAIGHRVGHPEKTKSDLSTPDLSSQDIIDLIGAAGRLGGKLHMMTRALADQLEPRTETLSNKALVQLCGHLGALNMFPHRLAAALEEVLSQRDCGQFALEDRLKLLQAFGRLRWRCKVLSALLESLSDNSQLDSLGVEALGGIIYELYRLDIWDEGLANGVCSRLRCMLVGPVAAAESPRPSLSTKTAANLLLALSYFAVPEVELQRRLVQELLRSKKIPQEALYQLKTFEMAVRVGHAAVTLKDLGGLAARWLFSVRGASGIPESRVESGFADEVSKVARNISWHHQAEVEVGPYLLDFAAVSRDEFQEEPEGWDDSKPGRSLARFCVAVEADGPSHFYRPHGRPWHWTSTSKLRHRLLSAMRIRVAHVPFYDWLQLEGLAQKEAYLIELLLKAHSSEFASLSIDSTGAAGKSADASGKSKASFVQRRLLARSRASRDSTARAQ